MSLPILEKRQQNEPWLMKNAEHSVSTAVVQPKVSSEKELRPLQHVWSETRQELTSGAKHHGISCQAYP